MAFGLSGGILCRESISAGFMGDPVGALLAGKGERRPGRNPIQAAKGQ
jgi:hypothetical protein